MVESNLKSFIIGVLLILGFLGFIFSFGEDIDLRAGKNILLTPDPIIREGIIATTEDPIFTTMNITGNITANQLYGEMWFHSDTTFITTVIDTQGVYVNLTGFDGGDENGRSLNGFRNDTDNIDTLIVEVDGKYKIDSAISFGNTGNNQEYQFVVFINEITKHQSDIHRKVGSAGDVGNAGTSALIDLENGDKITLRVRNNDGTGNLQVHSANLNLIRIGDIQ